LNQHIQQLAELTFSVPTSHYWSVQEYWPVSHQLRISASP